jgi:hypothetical protein
MKETLVLPSSVKANENLMTRFDSVTDLSVRSVCIQV